MENEQDERSTGKGSVARPDPLARTPYGHTMTLFGKELISLDVHFVAQLPTETSEEDIMPFGLSEREKETFFRSVSALRPHSISSRFSVNRGTIRPLPTVEPRFERRVVDGQGTLITIIMHRVMRQDILVQVRDRNLIVSGLVREPANADEGTESNFLAHPERMRKPRFLYNYTTGVTKMVELASIFAGYREGHVDLFLRHADPRQVNQEEEVQLEEAQYPS